MRESVIYQDIKAEGIREGEAKGRAEGIKEGKAEGIKEGIKEEAISLVLRLLKRRIGEINAEDESLITCLSVEQLEALGEALLDFSSSDDLRMWLAKKEF